MGKLADKWEKECFARCGAGWRNDISLVSMWHRLERQDRLNEEAKELKKQGKEELREQVILTLEARIEEIALKQHLTINEIEDKITELLTSETVDIAEKFKELDKVRFLLKDYHQAILNLEMQEPHKPHYEKKVEELAQFATDKDFKIVLENQGRELAQSFKTLRTALSALRKRRTVKQ